MHKLFLICLLLSGFGFAQTAHEVDLTCTPPTSGPVPTGYNIYRATVSGGPYTLQNSTPQTVCSYKDTSGLVEGTKYFYVATSVGQGGESVQSNEASALIPFSKPSPPTLNPPVVK